MPFFQVMVGQHAETFDGPEGVPIDCIFQQGSKFWSKSNLDKLNSPGMPPKFIRLPDDTPRKHLVNPLTVAIAKTTAKEEVVEGPADPWKAQIQSGQAVPPKQPFSQEKITPNGGESGGEDEGGEEDNSSNDFNADTIDTMTVAELKKLAEEEEIDVSHCTVKADYVKTLKAALSS